ncbi:MAG: hypothetical protein EA406_03190 [Rhodospirillales bacterium]|nr:MAG: hypothetical protein EA406_03190 [Rhodospirillales bacterium]
MRTAVALSLAVLAAGCAEMAGVQVAVVAGTGKTMVDHVVSLASGKDCSIVRKEQGRTYCREDEAVPAMPQHCYQTLGAIDCYVLPDPDAARRRPVPDTPVPDR